MSASPIQAEINGLPIFCKDSPLIPQSDIPKNWRELYNAVARLPSVPGKAERGADPFMRCMNLATLEEFYFPAMRDLRAATGALRILLKGLADRTPNAEYWRLHNQQCAALSGKAPLSPRCKSATSMGIVGVSGAGKSTSLENLLNRINQVIEHDQSTNVLLPRRQIVWLKLACPVNRTPRAFITDFFTSIDSLTGSNYADASGKENDDELITRMGKIARAHFLGLLVIDEIQNAAGKSKSTDRRLMKLFVRISATIGVPIVFVGTPKSQDILNAELADARRMIGPQWLPYAADNKEWNQFLDALWKYQYTATETLLDPLPEKAPPTEGGLRAKLFELTQGIPALAKALYALAQERVIMCSKREPSERITTKILQQTFDEDMQSVAAAINALRTKQALDVYDDLLPKELPKPKAWENSEMFEQLAMDCYQDSLERAARRKAREKAEELFGSQQL